MDAGVLGGRSRPRNCRAGVLDPEPGQAASHPSFVGALPSDKQLYGGGKPSAAPGPASPPPGGPLALAAGPPRFPLCGPGDPPELYLPLSGSILAGASLGAIVGPAP